MDSGGTTAEGDPQTQEVLFMANGPGRTAIPPTTMKDHATKHGNVIPGQPPQMGSMPHLTEALCTNSTFQ